MAEVKLSLVDENYKPPEKPSNAEVLQAHQAAGIREGLRRGREKLAEQWKLATEALTTASQRVTEITRSHDAHLTAAKKASFHQGVTYASFVWLMIAAACLFAGAWFQTSGWSMRVSDERIPRASVPAITDNYQEPEYDRDRREPGDAP